jgi:hypothetical protein
MSLYIPANVTNIILEYYAQINDLCWDPFVDVKTGETKRRVNKYSTKYDNINKLLEHRQKNLVHNITIDVEIMRYGEIIDSYNTIGTRICLKIEDISDYRNNIKIIDSYIEFIDKYNNKYSVFYSAIGRLALRNKYDIYEDGNIYGILIDYGNFDKTHYSLILEKF